jgi:hypothetical protein
MEWDEQGRLTLYEVYEQGICLWRRCWEADALVEEWRLAETDRDYGTLQMLRQHFLQGLREPGEGGADAG